METIWRKLSQYSRGWIKPQVATTDRGHSGNARVKSSLHLWVLFFSLVTVFFSSWVSAAVLKLLDTVAVCALWTGVTIPGVEPIAAVSGV